MSDTTYKPMSRKEMRDHFGVSRQTFSKWVNALPEALRALVPMTNSIMPPATIRKLFEHWVA